MFNQIYHFFAVSKEKNKDANLHNTASLLTPKSREPS